MKKVFLFITTIVLFVACNPKSANQSIEQKIDSTSTIMNDIEQSSMDSVVIVEEIIK